ncbi:MAG: cupin domain-containing protein [Cyanobacteria bacterium J003]|nr:MAG: cupin domain-containing protein [Cyanobacteria bacterium J003]
MNTWPAKAWIEALDLQPHPEGGYFREVYRSAGSIPRAVLPSGFQGGDRAYCTSIYFLLPSTACSRLHRIASDELWHFYTGSSLTLHVILPTGEYQPLRLGINLDQGEQLQQVVPAGAWFGATVDMPDSFSLVGCTVAPGFDFRDFELGDRQQLQQQFPQHQRLIERLTL